ncbi:hypothetical protein PMAYCL1PPCAC_19846, partial [Pristionchus mayeri]
NVFTLRDFRYRTTQLILGPVNGLVLDLFYHLLHCLIRLLSLAQSNLHVADSIPHAMDEIRPVTLSISAILESENEYLRARTVHFQVNSAREVRLIELGPEPEQVHVVIREDHGDLDRRIILIIFLLVLVLFFIIIFHSTLRFDAHFPAQRNDLSQSRILVHTSTQLRTNQSEIADRSRCTFDDLPHAFGRQRLERRELLIYHL